MDEQNTTPTQQPQPVMMDTMPKYDTLTPNGTVAGQKTSYHHKKKWGWAILIVVAVIVILLGVWLFFRHRKAVQDPAQTLQTLKQTSQPVTATVTERATAVGTLNNQANPVPVSQGQQLDMLSKLSK